MKGEDGTLHHSAQLSPAQRDDNYHELLFATVARASCWQLPLLLLETMRGLMHDDSNLKALGLSLQRWASFNLAQILLTVVCTSTEFGTEQVSSSFNCSEREKQL